MRHILIIVSIFLFSLTVISCAKKSSDDSKTTTDNTTTTTATGNDCETKKEYGENDEYMSHLVSYKWIRKTQVIPEYVVFYKNWGFYLEGCLTVKN